MATSRTRSAATPSRAISRPVGSSTRAVRALAVALTSAHPADPCPSRPEPTAPRLGGPWRTRPGHALADPVSSHPGAPRQSSPIQGLADPTAAHHTRPGGTRSRRTRPDHTQANRTAPRHTAAQQTAAQPAKARPTSPEPAPPVPTHPHRTRRDRATPKTGPATPRLATAEHARTDPDRSHHASPRRCQPRRIPPNPTRPRQTRPDTAPANRAEPNPTGDDHARPHRSRPGLALTRQTSACQTKTRRTTPDHASPRLTEPGPSTPSQDRADHTGARSGAQDVEGDDLEAAVGGAEVGQADESPGLLDDRVEQVGWDVLGGEHGELEGGAPAGEEGRPRAGDGVHLNLDAVALDRVPGRLTRVGDDGRGDDAGLEEILGGLAGRARVLAVLGGGDDGAAEVRAGDADVAVGAAVDVGLDVVGLLGAGALSGLALLLDGLGRPGGEEDRGGALDGDARGVRGAEVDRGGAVVGDRDQHGDHGTLLW